MLQSMKITLESTNRYGSVSKEKQTHLDDFLGRFLHSEVLIGSSSESSYQGPMEQKKRVSPTLSIVGGRIFLAK